MDGHVRMIIIVCLAFAFLYSDAANIADDQRTNLTTQNPGILNIDCGVDEDYFDETTGLHYKSDKGFVSTGENGVVSSEFENYDLYNLNYTRLTKNLRYFPKGRKNCYTIRLDQGKNNNYMIQVLFKYGNYDGLNQTLFKFDLFLDVHYWATIQVTQLTWFYRTAFYFSPKDFIMVCLVNTGIGIPFISALQVRPISNSIYRTDSGFAEHMGRIDVGIPNNTYVRYKDDFYDRIWSGYMLRDWVLLDNPQSLRMQDSNDSYRIPSQVWRTAVQPKPNLTSLNFSYYFNLPLRSFNAYFYFSELQSIPEGQKREFNITLNGVQYGPFTTQYLKPQTVICNKAQLSERQIQFSIYPTENSDLPPILNGFEILIDKITASETNPADVSAIMGIQKIYSIDRPGWQGDPCEPKAFPWEGLNCSYANNTTRITSLNLASSELYGEIASEFFNLKELQSLDLSNNNLTGLVPGFLAELPNLVSLDISGNQLTGPLPQSLVEKFRNGTLKLSFSLKPNPCSSGSCDKKGRNVLIPILVSIIVFLAFLVILLVFSRIKTHKVAGFRNGSILISRNRSFTYSEIVNLTGNFTNMIGEGGFGKVYHGELNDGTQVAVKLLSHSSKQGFKEFLSEVQLLLMVYHRNLVSLIGYCEEKQKLALVYEYMENGNLRKFLADESSYILNWRERLQIALDAAKGLEYLHNGCKPPIVHRDLKTSNILLNEHLIGKISDFGLSRVFANDRDTHVTTYPAGTLGYVDPELNRTGNLNKKSDVYSFGIILFELITGQPAVIKGEDENVHILQWVTPMIESGDIHSIVDQRLEGEFDANSAWKVVEIAMSCTPTAAIQRPDMGHVLVELQECVASDMALGGSQTLRSVSSVTKSSNALQMSSVIVDAQVLPRVR